jgi:tRNA dimethylallyltransferase
MEPEALRVPVILGPTGIGKSRAAFEVARRLDGEIVVADSRQVYRGLDIATNKPGPAERDQVAYHMIDVAEPSSRISVHEWAKGAADAIAGIAGRGRLPIVEGGSSLYVDVLADGFNLAGVPPRPGRRQELERLDVAGLARLVDQLDPEADVDRRNPVRLVRAVEILEAAGPPLSRHRRRQPPGWEALRIGLQAPLEVIDERLRRRSLEQVRRGLIDETISALEASVPESAGVLSGIGYREALAHLRGELSLEQLPQAMAAANRRYARRQLRWLRRDERVHWIDAVDDPVPAILGYLETVLP